MVRLRTSQRRSNKGEPYFFTLSFDGQVEWNKNKIMKDTFVMVLSFDLAEYNIYIVINTVQLFAIIKLWTINPTYYGNCDLSG